MRPYNRGNLLVYIHIPKTAGTSARLPFEVWFGEQCHPCYDPQFHEAPLPHLPDPPPYDSKHPVVFYGHFRRENGYGVKDYFPRADQFMTMIRDPFEQAVSKYFYLRKEGVNHIDRSGVPCCNMESYLLNLKSDILDYFPEELTHANFKDQIEQHYIDIGITEHFAASIERFARKLDMPYDARTIGRANSTERNQDVPQYLRDRFMERHELEYAVYDYALQKHHAEEAANPHMRTTQ